MHFLILTAIVVFFAAIALLNRDGSSLRARIRLVFGNLGADTGALNFIPEVWAAQLLVSLKKALVFGQPTVSNRDYEGDIAEAGDTVHIRSIGRPTISNYSRYGTLTYEQLTDADRTLVIDQAKSFSFVIDDIDDAQARGDQMDDAALAEAAYGLADLADQYIASLHTGVQSANNLGTVAVTTATPTDAYDKVLVPLKVKLDEANVPSAGRYVVVPPWLHGRLLLDSRFIKINESGTSEGLRNGMVGRATGFDILVSNNAPFVTGDDWEVIAGIPNALSYAEQISKVEALRLQTTFGDGLRGLHLYGAKLVRPDALAVAQVSQT